MQVVIDVRPPRTRRLGRQVKPSATPRDRRGTCCVAFLGVSPLFFRPLLKPPSAAFAAGEAFLTRICGRRRLRRQRQPDCANCAEIGLLVQVPNG